LSFASHQLAVHPDVQNKLQGEIDATLQHHGGELTHQAVHSMKYLDMVLSGEYALLCPSGASTPPIRNSTGASPFLFNHFLA
jgi:hypothetical protein